MELLLSRQYGKLSPRNGGAICQILLSKCMQHFHWIMADFQWYCETKLSTEKQVQRNVNFDVGRDYSCKSWPWPKLTPMELSDSLLPSAPRLRAASKWWIFQSRRTDRSQNLSDMMAKTPMSSSRRNLESPLSFPPSERTTNPNWCEKANASIAMNKTTCLLFVRRSRNELKELEQLKEQNQTANV